jgi:hypothetical protein
MLSEQQLQLSEARYTAEREASQLALKVVELDAAKQQMQGHSAELVAELRDARAEVAQRAQQQQARTQAQARLAESAAHEQVAVAEMRWRDTVSGLQSCSNPEPEPQPQPKPKPKPNQVSGLEEQLRHARVEAAAAVAERDRRGDVGWRTREVGLVAEAATLRATNAALEEEARRLRGRLGLELTGNRAAAHVLGSQLSAMRDEQQAQQATQRLLEDANLHLVNELRRAAPPRRVRGRAAAPPSRVSTAHAAAAVAASVLSAHRGLDPGAAHLSSWEAEVEAGARTRLGLQPQPQPQPQHRSPDHSCGRSRSRSPTPPPPPPAAADGYAWSLPHPLGGLAEARGSILDTLSPPPPPPTTPATARPSPGPNAPASLAAAAYGAARQGGAAPAVARAHAVYAASSYEYNEAAAAQAALRAPGGAGTANPEVLPILEPHAFRGYNLMHPGCNPMHPGCNPMHPGCNPMHPGCSPMHPGCSLMHPGCSLMHPGCSLMHPGCSLMHPKLQAGVSKAATPCIQSCRPMHPGEADRRAARLPQPAADTRARPRARRRRPRARHRRGRRA